MPSLLTGTDSVRLTRARICSRPEGDEELEAGMVKANACSTATVIVSNSNCNRDINRVRTVNTT